MSRKDRSSNGGPSSTPFPNPPIVGGGEFRSQPVDVQRLWFATRSRPWAFLVVMPSQAGGSAVRLAQALADVGTQHRGSPVRMVDAESASVGEASRLILDIISQNGTDGMTVVAVGSPLSSPAAIPISLASDAVLLAVTLGEADFTSIERTLETIGRERFIGSVALS